MFNFHIDKKTLWFIVGFVIFYGILSFFLVSKGLGFVAILGLFLMAYQILAIQARRLERSEELNAYDRYYRNPPREKEYRKESSEVRSERVKEQGYDKDIKRSKDDVVEVRPKSYVRERLNRPINGRQSQGKDMNRIRKQPNSKPNQKQRNPLEDEGF